MAEAFFSTLKRELVNRHRYPDRATARRSIFEWLTRYNTRRRHTSLDFLTPGPIRSPLPSHRGNHPRLIHLTGQRGEVPSRRGSVGASCSARPVGLQPPVPGVRPGQASVVPLRTRGDKPEPSGLDSRCTYSARKGARSAHAGINPNPVA